MRYDINNNGIFLACCKNCGNEVGITTRLELVNPELSKVVDCAGNTNNLMVLDKIMACCKKPNYSFIDSWRFHY